MFLRHPFAFARPTFACIVLSLAGCSGVKVKNMLPDSLSSNTAHHAQSIRIGGVTGNQKEFFGGPEMVNAEEFKTVLTEAFVRSKLFASVVSPPAGDLELSAKFLAHGQVSKGLNVEQAMVIEYSLVNLRSGKELWKQSINSRQAATVGDALGGAKRTRMAQEGCVRKNVEQLVGALGTLTIE